MPFYSPDHWQPLSAELVQPLSSAQIDWLTNADSLTKRLRQLTHNTIEHHLLFNNWNEAGTHWIRNMEWRYQTAVWFACVVSIPKDSLIDELTDIGHRSIGDILFAEPSLKRSEFHYQKKGCHYSRHSVFYFKEKPIDLVETFFPAFFEAISCLEK